MRIRQLAIAGGTLPSLTIGLPAAGVPIPGIYHVSWGAEGTAYSSVEGACGFVDTTTLEASRHQVFCFGDTLDVRSGPTGGQASRVGLWVLDRTCVGAPRDQQCTEQSFEVAPHGVTYSIDPLLQTASVVASVAGCGAVNLTLAADTEPSLRTAAPVVVASAGVNFVEASVGGGAASVGRDAGVSGTLCGVSVNAGNSRGRIFRGLGSPRGASIGVSYTPA